MATATPARLVLASASPRRRRLLAGLGLQFEVRPVAADESPLPGEGPRAMVERLARLKAAGAANPGGRGGAAELILAADTVVVLDGELLGKPDDPDDAARMLGRLAGRVHQVLTGVAVLDAGRGETGARREAYGVETSEVRIAPLSPAEIDWYVATGEPLDKAGAYAIQGLGALFVETVAGNYTNVVGLPLPLTRRLFAELEADLLRFRTGRRQALPRVPTSSG